MAAPYNPPVKGEDLVLHIAVGDAVTQGKFLSGVTPATGEFKITKDDGSATNLATSAGASSYVIQHPANPLLLKVFISASDMNADIVTITGQDATSPPAWVDFILSIPTTS